MSSPQNACDQRLVRCIAWFCGEVNVSENQRKAMDYEYDSGDDKSGKRVAKSQASLHIAACVVGAATKVRAVRANCFRHPTGGSVSRRSDNGRTEGGGAVCEITDEQVATEHA